MIKSKILKIIMLEIRITLLEKKLIDTIAKIFSLLKHLITTKY